MSRKEFLIKVGLGTFGLMIGRSVIGQMIAKTLYENGGSFDNILIGTGYGNAVVAERLANAGKHVLMLEMGLDWEGYKQQNPDFKFYKMTCPGKESTWMKNKSQAPIAIGNMFSHFNKFTGILERQDFDHIKIYLGKGIGGGSLVNGGMTVVPNKDYLKLIFKNVGVDFPVEECYETFFPMANKNLGKQQVPEDIYNSKWYKFARMGVEEGIAAGFKEIEVPNLYDFEYMRKEINGEVPPSATNVEVIYGNNYGKQDLTKTYLKRALKTGNVTILPQHRVDYIKANLDGTFTLNTSQIDTIERTITTKNFTCKKVYLGAGSLGSTELLLKSKTLKQLPKINNEVGKYWGNNGNTMASRFTHFVLGHPSRGTHQATMPVRGLSNFDDPQHPFFAEIAPMPVFGSHTGLYLIVNKLKSFGTLSYSAQTKKLDLEWSEKHNAHMRENAAFFLKKMNEFGSTGWFNSKYKNNTILFPNNGIDEHICYHPLGGCVLGKATDLYGRVKGYRNLYVTDGSLIPGTLGVNPYVTITALAERNIQNILQKDY